MEERTTFGEIVKRERLFLEMDQKTLGERISVSGTYITQIEKGYKIPSLSVIVRLAAALALDEKSLIRVALREKAPKEAKKYFGDDVGDPLSVLTDPSSGKGERLHPKEVEIFKMMRQNQGIKREMTKYFDFLKKKAGGGRLRLSAQNAALEEFLSDPEMPQPTAEELRLLMSLELEGKREPTKWFYKSILDDLRNEALLKMKRQRRRAPVRLLARDVR